MRRKQVVLTKYGRPATLIPLRVRGLLPIEIDPRVGALPKEVLGLCTRAQHVVGFLGCNTIGDVAALTTEDVFHAPNAGAMVVADIWNQLYNACAIAGAVQ